MTSGVEWGELGKAHCHGCPEKDFGLHPPCDTEILEGLEWGGSLIFLELSANWSYIPQHTCFGALA